MLRSVMRLWTMWLAVAWACVTGLARAAEAIEVPRVHTLASDGRWLLQASSGRFDASALLLLPDGQLVTVNDKELPLCRIRLGTNGVARLKPDPELFPLALVRAAVGSDRYVPDNEGLACDEQGRLYLCTEGARHVFRLDAARVVVKRMAIDWAPVKKWFAAADGNAAWEGIAVGGGRMYLANERGAGRIIVVDLATERVVDDFRLVPAGQGDADVSYTDLCWHRGELWVLCREARRVLRVEPATHRILEEYDFRELEKAGENAYITALPYGFMEGLAVDDSHIWLAADNNGLPRMASPTDSRPILLRCPRPGAGAGSAAGPASVAPAATPPTP